MRRIAEKRSEVSHTRGDDAIPDEYDFLEYMAQFADYPSYCDPLKSTRVSDLIDQGLILWPPAMDDLEHLVDEMTGSKEQIQEKAMKEAQDYDDPQPIQIGEAGVPPKWISVSGPDNNLNTPSGTLKSCDASGVLGPESLSPLRSTPSQREQRPGARTQGSPLFLPDEEAVDELLWNTDD